MERTGTSLALLAQSSSSCTMASTVVKRTVYFYFFERCFLFSFFFSSRECLSGGGRWDPLKWSRSGHQQQGHVYGPEGCEATFLEVNYRVLHPVLAPITGLPLAVQPMTGRSVLYSNGHTASLLLLVKLHGHWSIIPINSFIGC